MHRDKTYRSSIVDDETGIDFMGGLVPTPLTLEELN